MLHDKRRITVNDYQATEWPVSFIIDRDGVFGRKVWDPAERDDQAEVAVFRRLLGLYESIDEG